MLTDYQPCAFLVVRDIDEARAFYADVLGLQDDGFDGFALKMRLGPINLRVAKVEGWSGQPHTVLGWESADIAADVAALSAKGVAVERYAWTGEAQDAAGIWTAPTGDKVAWFRDPSGNNLSLAQHV